MTEERILPIMDSAMFPLTGLGGKSARNPSENPPLLGSQRVFN